MPPTTHVVLCAIDTTALQELASIRVLAYTRSIPVAIYLRETFYPGESSTAPSYVLGYHETVRWIVIFDVCTITFTLRIARGFYPTHTLQTIFSHVFARQRPEVIVARVRELEGLPDLGQTQIEIDLPAFVSPLSSEAHTQSELHLPLYTSKQCLNPPSKRPRPPPSPRSPPRRPISPSTRCVEARGGARDAPLRFSLASETAVLRSAHAPHAQTAADIANNVTKKLIALAVEGAKVIDLCVEGDKLLEQGTGGVYNKSVKGVKVSKGASRGSHSQKHTLTYVLFRTVRQKASRSRRASP